MYQSPTILSLAVPFYNESAGLEGFFAKIIPILEATNCPFEIVCVNDGSTDNTWELLRQMAAKHGYIRAFDLSRNFGKEAALTAALDQCRGEAIIPIDADLQDPPELIPEMIKKWQEGYEVVVAQRRSRSTDSMSKRLSSKWFYKIFNFLAETPIDSNAGDFRLIDRKALSALAQLRESNRFMKGLFSWVGFRTTTVEFDRQPRLEGESKWSPWKLWNFALDGIFAFSNFPLRVWTYVGGMVSLLSFIYASFLILRTILFGIDVPGYASLMVIILFLGGIHLIGLGVLGEYLGRIYREVKHRPLYIIRETTDS